MRIKLIHPLPLGLIVKLLGIPLTVGGSISYVTTDSREALPGDLFVSLAKDSRSALSHTSEALMRGAITLGSYGELCVDDAPGALLSIAAHCKDMLSGLRHTVAVSGSVGKTTTKEFLHTILSSCYRVHSTAGNRNNRIGVPLTVLSAPEDSEVLVVELGMNHAGEISELSHCVRPDVAVITNIGSAHIGNLGSREAIAEAKLEVLNGMTEGALICPLDEPLLSSAPMRSSFSLSDKGADYALTRCHGTDTYTLHTPSGNAQIVFPYSNTHILHDLLAAAAAAHACGMTPSQIKDGVALIDRENLRHRITRHGSYSVLNDSYNSSYESASAALEMLSSADAPVRSALLGDMHELGEHSYPIHVRLGMRAATLGLDKLYLMGEYSDAVGEGARLGGMANDKIFIIRNTDNFASVAAIIKEMASDGELILVKGSHASGLYKVAEILEGERDD